MANDSDWKIKYFASLKQLVEKESTWDGVEDLLRKTISYLVITGKGLNKPMDQVLLQIKTHSRSGDNKALQADLDDISNLLSKLTDDVNEPQRKDEDTLNHGHILMLLQNISAHKDSLHRLEELKISLPEKTQEESLLELAELINTLINDERHDVEMVREVLLALIEKISLVHGNSARLREIREQLETGFEVEQWQVYLDGIISEIRFIMHDISHEKIELEGLVIDVSRQLTEISTALNAQHNSTIEEHNDTLYLKTIMDESVNNIQSSLENASDINKLKTNINNNIGSIKGGLKEFVVKEEERFQTSESRNNELQVQIKKMESESGSLKQKLSENRKLLMYDTLTGARSRLSYEEVLEQELARWLRQKKAFSFALMDIDHFKKVNDMLGHSAGDKALQIVTKVMLANIRKTDFLFRIGGEEFVLILPATRLEVATPLVEKIRSTVSATHFRYKQQEVGVTMSVGLTAIINGDDVNSIYERADAAMYQAKQRGRDQLKVIIL